MDAKRNINGQRHLWRVPGVAALLAAAAIAAGCAPPGDASGNGDLGTVRLALTAPPGVGCVRLRFVAGREMTRDVPVSSEVTTRLDALPTGMVAITGAAFAGACGAGDPLWLSEPLTVTLRAGQPADVRVVFRKNGIALVSADFIDDEFVSANLALNPSCTGFPSVAESDRGWGGGSNQCDIVDGLHSYDTWARGLAFTGGHQNAGGGPPYIEPAGLRRAVVDFGSPKKFAKLVIWWHGAEYTPQTGTIDYWDGAQWVAITGVQRSYGTMHEDGSNSGYSDSDIYTFAAVTGSKVRYSFDNSGNNINGTLNIHGWIYEVEVFSAQ